MKPSVGRIVHFHPLDSDCLGRQNGAEFVPAIITRVWGEDTVNLKLFPDGEGNPVRRSVGEKSSMGEGNRPYWEWPPRV